MKEIKVEISEGKMTSVWCEDEHYNAMDQILIGGEYEVPGTGFSGNPIVVDIGAAIGAFSIWTLKRWNPSFVYCYEPLKKHFEQLHQNISNLPEISTKFTLVNKAVEAPSNKLYLGSKSTASSSFYDLHEQSEIFEEVETMAAEELPECHILKVDTEGCEIDIITKYLYSHNRPSLIMFEFHRDKDRQDLDKLLYTFNYKLFGGFLYGYQLGVFKYVADSMIKLKKG